MKQVWIAIFCIVLLWSGTNPKDYLIWFLEVVPALIGFVVLAITYNSFRLTPLTYILILIHCIILMIGGHYTYAEVPFFDYIKETFELQRNNYDKVGHFAQGFVPAIIAKEIFIRKNVIVDAGWQNFLVICFCLAFSAFYELIEWWVALLSGEDAVAFLATQGDVWDTQSDMAIALIGAITALMFLSGVLHHQIKHLKSSIKDRLWN